MSQETAYLQGGYRLTRTELRLLSGLELSNFAELAGQLRAGRCRSEAKKIFICTGNSIFHSKLERTVCMKKMNFMVRLAEH